MNGGTGREVEGTWSATLEWLVGRLAPEFAALTFVEVRYRIKSWKRLDWCIDDCRAAVSDAVEGGAAELALLGFSMGGAVSIAAADHPRVSTVIGLAPWIPDRLEVATLDGRRLAIVHGSLDRWLPGVPGVSPASSLRGFERARAREVEATYTIVPGGLHGLAVRSRRGGLVPLPRARHWADLVAAELRGFESGWVHRLACEPHRVDPPFDPQERSTSMAFARMFNNPNVTKEQYDAVREMMGVSNDNVPQGGLIHFAGEGPDGTWRVVEVWESEDAARAWDEKLEPVLSERGITRPAPETWQVHNLIKS